MSDDVISRRASARRRRRLVIVLGVSLFVTAGGAAVAVIRRLPARPVPDQPVARDTATPVPARPPASVPRAPSAPTTARADDGRHFWRYAANASLPATGHFRRMSDGWWEEVGRDGVTVIGAWEEVGRNAEHVELYDPRRNTTARLGAGRAWLIAGRRTKELGTALEGDWENGPSASDAGPQSDARAAWLFGSPYRGAEFRRTADGRWRETNHDTHAEMGVWDEVARTPEYVEVYDPKRNYSIRLGAGRSWLASGRGPGVVFGPSYAGDWEIAPRVAATPPAVPPLPEVKGPPRPDPLRDIARGGGGLDASPAPTPEAKPDAKAAPKPDDPATPDTSEAGKNGFLPAPGKEPPKPKANGKAPAKEADKRPPLGPKLDPLVDQLTGRVAKDRLKAAQQLGEMGAAAAPAARYLCSALLDPVPAVSTAALKSLETVAPELYTPLATIRVDGDPLKRFDALKVLGKLGEKGQPAVPFLLGCLAAEAAGLPSPFMPGVQVIGISNAHELSAAIRATGDESAETIRAYRAFAGPGGVYPAARLDAINFLVTWAGEEADRRATVAPLVVGGLSDGRCQMTCITTAGNYGKLCAPALPALKQLKLSPDAATRAAATKAVTAIEGAE